MSQLYAEYVKKMRRIADISNASAVLYWDDEVYLPELSNNLRAQQIATLAGIVHQEFTSPKFGKILKALSQEKLPFRQARNIASTFKDFKRDGKFKTEFVIRKSHLVSQAYHSWHMAKTKNDFSLFENDLDKLLLLVREEAAIMGYKGHPYNAMLDLYEAGITVDKLDKLFGQVKEKLIPLIAEICQRPQVDSSFLNTCYPKDDQWQFGLALLKSIGFDFKMGRQDISSHPFTTSFGAEDVRLTTRIDEKDIANMTWSCIHEGGHGLYEQGLDHKEYGLPSGSAASLGIHESQSRLWENNVGRSYEFWQFHFPKMKKKFPSQLHGVRLIDFYKAINKVKPGKIRTDADELHYHLHVLIRYELEKEILGSKIKAKELRALWNEKYKAYIGVNIKNDKEGILQDVHWSHCSFGYFPTYTLGSFYAAQFYAKANQDLPDLKKEISNGNTSSLLFWLRNNIHKHGKTYNAEELCKKVTGKHLQFEYFLAYVKEKYRR